MALAFRRQSPTQPPWAVVGEGILAGLAGTAVMTLAQTQVIPRLPIPEGREPPRKPKVPAEPQAKKESTTATAARRLVTGLAMRPLPPEKKEAAGYLVHFGFGAAWGAALSMVMRRPTIPRGLAFGAAVWMLSDNVLLPLLRLGDWPDRYPPGTHAKALLAHLAYGAGTAAALAGLYRGAARTPWLARR